MRSEKPRLKPRQARSKVTVKAILQATAQLLLEVGYDSLTTNHIAKTAGVSVGSLYRYFPDKNAIIMALVDGLAEQRIAEFQSHLLNITQHEDELEAGATALVKATISSLSIEPKLSYVLIQLNLPHRLELQRAWRQQCSEVLASAFRNHAHLLRRGEPSMMAHVVVVAVHEVITDALAHRPHWIDDPAFEAELIALVIAYLQPKTSTI